LQSYILDTNLNELVSTRDAEAQPKKVQLPLPLFKELKPIRILLLAALLTKIILKNLFAFCLITLVASCHDI